MVEKEQFNINWIRPLLSIFSMRLTGSNANEYVKTEMVLYAETKMKVRSCYIVWYEDRIFRGRCDVQNRTYDSRSIVRTVLHIVGLFESTKTRKNKL